MSQPDDYAYRLSITAFFTVGTIKGVLLLIKICIHLGWPGWVGSNLDFTIERAVDQELRNSDDSITRAQSVWCDDDTVISN